MPGKGLTSRNRGAAWRVCVFMSLILFNYKNSVFAIKIRTVHTCVMRNPEAPLDSTPRRARSRREPVGVLRGSCGGPVGVPAGVPAQRPHQAAARARGRGASAHTRGAAAHAWCSETRSAFQMTSSADRDEHVGRAALARTCTRGWPCACAWTTRRCPCFLPAPRLPCCARRCASVPADGSEHSCSGDSEAASPSP